MPNPGRRTEDPFIVARLKIQFRRGDHPSHCGALGRSRHGLGRGLETDDCRRSAVGQYGGQLTVAVHRIDRNDDGTELPDRDCRDHELRNILQDKGNSVCEPDSILGEGYGKRIRHLVELGKADGPVEVLMIGGQCDRAPAKHGTSRGRRRARCLRSAECRRRNWRARACSRTRWSYLSSRSTDVGCPPASP